MWLTAEALRAVQSWKTMPPRSTLRTRRFLKTLHFNLLLRDLRDLCGEMSVSSFLRLPRWVSAVNAI
jgi:hypothetical protein